MKLFTLSFLLLWPLGAWSQGTPSNWLFPTSEDLLAAAKRGFERGKAAKLKPYTILIGKCGKVMKVSLATPVDMAVALGEERRKKFESPPDEPDVLENRGTLLIDVFLLPDNKDTDAEAAILLEGRLLKPTSKLVHTKDIQQVACLLSLGQEIPRWVIGIAYQFRFDPSQPPPKGKCKLLLRLTDGKEQEIELDFDKMAHRP
jgi:hypothetical protein